MNGAAQFRLPLDIDHFAFAETGGCGDARGHTVTEITQVDDRDAIDLSDLSAVGIDHQHATLHRLAEMVARSTMTLDLSITRTVDIIGPDFVAPGLSGPVGGFLHKVADVTYVRGQFAGVFHLAHAELDHGGDRRPVKGR